MAAPPTCLCFRCPAKCCRYLAIQIDTPEKAHEFEQVRWQLSHRDVFIFIEEGKWYIHLDTTCQKLRPDNRCSIYEQRPQICQDYSWVDCDFSGADYQWSAKLSSPAELSEYVERLPNGLCLPPFPQLAQLSWNNGSPEQRTLSKSHWRNESVMVSQQLPLSKPASSQDHPKFGGLGFFPLPIQAPATQPAWLGEQDQEQLNPIHEVSVFIDTPNTWEDLENIRWYVMHDRVRIRVDADDRWTLLYRTVAQAGYGPGHERCDTHCQPNTDAGEGRYPRIFSDAESLLRFASQYHQLRKAAS